MATSSPIRLLVFAFATMAPSSALAALDHAKIEQITGLKGMLNLEEGVFKVTAPRSDVGVTVNEWKMPPFMGLTSWAAFMPAVKSEAMVMGDLVLFADEINPAMSVALDAGMEVTALHNHFASDNPPVYFMHIEGEGSIEQLAGGVKAALDKIQEIRSHNPVPGDIFPTPFTPEKNAIDGSVIEEALAVKGQAKDGMFKVVIGRKVKMPCGCEAGKEMGINTWAAFAGTDDNAFVDGDFAVTSAELQPVLRSLRSSGIHIVAIHQHMTNEEPRLIFFHYVGRGSVAQLSKALRNAIETQAAQKP